MCKQVCMCFYLTSLEPLREIRRKSLMGFNLWSNASIHTFSNSAEHSGDFFCVSPLKGNQITSHSVNLRQLPSLGRTLPPEHLSSPNMQQTRAWTPPLDWRKKGLWTRFKFLVTELEDRERETEEGKGPGR